MTIGISFDQPGLGFQDGDTYTGFDVDTATYVAQALGVPKANITWKEADPGDRQQLISSGQVDLVFSSYSITDERKQQVSFAGPYFVAHQDLLVRRNEDQITGPETLDGKTLCSVTGTTSSDYLDDTLPGQDRTEGVPEVLRLRRGAEQQRGGCGDHRRRDPGRIRRTSRSTEASSGSSARASPTSVTGWASRKATPPWPTR